ncbi:MAG: glycosyltransferase family 4 protein [bacterium]|nr:glycosyltransferase family 4 protein [bacterium]
MKICILQTIHRPFDKRVFHKEAVSLAAAGHEVVSIAPTDEPVEDTAGVHFETFPMPKSLFRRFVEGMKLIPRGLRAKADVYMCIDPEAYVAGAVLRFIARKPFVMDVHEYYPADLAAKVPGPFRPLASWCVKRALRVTGALASHIILTKGCLDFLFEGLRTPRTVVLNTNHLQPICTDFPSHIAKRCEGRTVIIHEGDFGVLRGSWQWLDAMKILVKEVPDVLAVIIGRFTTGHEQEFRDAIHEAGLDDHFDMPGMVPFEEVPAYVGLSTVGLILFQPWVGISHELIMPHKMFDYMREAKPFITTDFPVEIKDVVEECDCAKVVDVENPEAIAKGVLELIRNPEEAERLGTNGRRAVESKYNWENDEQRLLAVFDALK